MTRPDDQKNQPTSRRPITDALMRHLLKEAPQCELCAQQSCWASVWVPNIRWTSSGNLRVPRGKLERPPLFYGLCERHLGAHRSKRLDDVLARRFAEQVAAKAGETES